MGNGNHRLADLHLHLYGSIHWQDFLESVRDRAVDWTTYEEPYRQVYGDHAPIRRVLESCRAGEPGSDEAFRRLFTFRDEDGGNFARFQAKYNLLNAGAGWAAFQGGESGFDSFVVSLCGFLEKIMLRQRTQNIGYAEQRMGLNSRFTPAQAQAMVEALLATCAAYDSPDYHPRFAVSISRQDPWPDWEVTRQAALGPNGRFLTAIDFCNMEEGYPPKDLRSFFDAVRDFNRQRPDWPVAILYHVGESFADKSLESAIRWVHESAEMGAHRLGHAIALGIDPAAYGLHTRQESVDERMDQLRYDLRHRDGLRRSGVYVDEAAIVRQLDELRKLRPGQLLSIDYDEERLREVRRRQRYAIRCISGLGAVIEVCPTSNRRIGGITNPDHHPLVRFVANDAPFVIGSDDPGIFGTTLRDEIKSAIAISGLPDDAYHEIAARSWRYRSELLVGRPDQDARPAPPGHHTTTHRRLQSCRKPG